MVERGALRACVTAERSRVVTQRTLKRWRRQRREQGRAWSTHYFPSTSNAWSAAHRARAWSVRRHAVEREAACRRLPMRAHAARHGWMAARRSAAVLRGVHRAQRAMHGLLIDACGLMRRAVRTLRARGQACAAWAFVSALPARCCAAAPPHLQALDDGSGCLLAVHLHKAKAQRQQLPTARVLRYNQGMHR